MKKVLFRLIVLLVLAGAVYGVILILVIYVMPSGAAGLVRLVVSKVARASVQQK